MTRLITLGRAGVIDADRIIAMASLHSTPIKRLVAKTAPERILNLTYGYPRETLVVLADGYLVIVSQTIDELTQVLGSLRIDQHEQPSPPFQRSR